MRVAGVDVGGSGVRVAVRPGDGPVLRARLTDRSVERVVDLIAGLAGELGPIDALGVGVPGFLTRDGTVVGSPNFPDWHDVPLRRLLTQRLGMPVAVENDANAAALGGWARWGQRDSLVLLTLGTGVGGGVVDVDGRLLRGTGTGAELGHIYAGGDAPCGCGGVGCLETWCSTVGLVRQAREHGHQLADGAAVVAAAERGEDWAVEVMNHSADALGRGLTTLVNLFAPRRLVLTGGLTAARDLLAPRAEAWLRRHGVAPSVQAVEVCWQGRAEDVALDGAATRAAQLLEA